MAWIARQEQVAAQADDRSGAALLGTGRSWLKQPAALRFAFHQPRMPVRFAVFETQRLNGDSLIQRNPRLTSLNSLLSTWRNVTLISRPP